MGCAAAYHLAKDGQRVRLLEQFDHRASPMAARTALPASSGWPTRAQDYVQLARTSYALWHELETESGVSLLRKMGGLDFGPPDAVMLGGIRTTYEAVGVPFEVLDRDEIVRRFPQFNLPEDTVGYYQPDYGLLDADRCVATLAAQARRHGATVHEREAVRTIGTHHHVRGGSAYRARHIHRRPLRFSAPVRGCAR